MKLDGVPEYPSGFIGTRTQLLSDRPDGTPIDLLALAHARGGEAELAYCVAADRRTGLLPDVAALREPFSPRSGCHAAATVRLASLAG